uniref:Cytochrome P450 n=1 Tax=Ammi majus TaxID=48026 RepID=Q6QNI2_AMMMJ|nr:cytochrome P450 [Ammi majus]
MDVIIIVLSVMLAYVLVKHLLLSRDRGKNLPPGPFQLPIIGNLTNLGKLPHRSLAKLSQNYGPIMHLQLGRVTTIVISSSAIAQQVFQKKGRAFSRRFIPDSLCACDHSLYSFVWLPIGPQWRNLRKISNSNLFSANKLDANQHLRGRKVNELIAYVQKCSQTGDAVDIGRAAFRTSFNLLSNTVFSKDMVDPYQDSAQEFKDLAWNIMVEAGSPNLVDYFPVLKKMDPQGVKRRMTGYFQKVIKMLDGLINERLALKGSGTTVDKTDMLDELINISQVNPNEMDKILMEHLFVDIFVAGTDTTSNTVEWGMAEILRSTETMMKVKAELRHLVGKGVILEEGDIYRLPFLQCIVRETLRLHPPFPLLLPRQTEEETELNGYTIPKNSQVLVNAWAIGRDPVSWKNPSSFRPERFLDSEVDVKGQDFELIPFGAGIRICPGLPLVMRMVPVMLGSLINCFDWELEGGIPLNELDMEEKCGLSVAKLHPLRVLATSQVV